MRIIKLDAIDSTNSYLRRLSAQETLKDNTVVMALKQTEGRGQMGTQWTAEDGKNLTVSVFKTLDYLNVQHSFYISMAVALSVFEGLQQFEIRKLKIKWPNDILADNLKIAGILIENVIKNQTLQGSVIGFGINVNQTNFKQLPKATSMQIMSGKSYNLEEVLKMILAKLETNFTLLKNKDFKALKHNYELQLFRKLKPSTFKDHNGTLFSGIIQGISERGQLLVLLEGNVIKAYSLKEVTLLY